MNNLFKLTFLCFLSFSIVSCGGDEDPSSDCDGLLASGGDMMIDGETLNLSIAQLLISSGLDGDVYQFQVGGIANDCTSSRVVSFIVEIPTGAELNGTYPIKDFFDAGLNDVYGVTVTDQVFDPVSQSLTEVASGSFEFTKNDTRDYTVDMEGDLVGGGSVSLNFRKAF